MTDIDHELAKADTLEAIQIASQAFVAFVIDQLRNENPELLAEVNDACGRDGRLQISISPAPVISAAAILVRPGMDPVQIGRLEGIPDENVH